MNKYSLTDDGENLEVKKERKYKSSLSLWSMSVLLFGAASVIIISGVFTFLPMKQVEQFNYQDYLDNLYHIHDVTLVMLILCVVSMLVVKGICMILVGTASRVRYYEEDGVLFAEKYKKSSDVWECVGVVDKHVVILQKVMLGIAILLALAVPLVVTFINISVGRL